MEREVGGGIGMGNTCKPMAVSFQCMTKFTTNKIIIIIIIIIIKISKKIKKRTMFSWTEMCFPVTSISLGDFCSEIQNRFTFYSCYLHIALISAQIFDSPS